MKLPKKFGHRKFKIKYRFSVEKTATVEAENIESAVATVYATLKDIPEIKKGKTKVEIIC